MKKEKPTEIVSYQLSSNELSNLHQFLRSLIQVYWEDVMLVLITGLFLERACDQSG